MILEGSKREKDRYDDARKPEPPLAGGVERLACRRLGFPRQLRTGSSELDGPWTPGPRGNAGHIMRVHCFLCP